MLLGNVVKLLIVDFKMDSELNSVSQNSQSSHLRAFSFKLQLVRLSDTPLTGQSKLQLLLFLHLSPHRTACPQVLFFCIMLGLTVAESCQWHFQQAKELHSKA